MQIVELDLQLDGWNFTEGTTDVPHRLRDYSETDLSVEEQVLVERFLLVDEVGSTEDSLDIGIRRKESLIGYCGIGAQVFWAHNSEFENLDITL